MPSAHILIFTPDNKALIAKVQISKILPSREALAKFPLFSNPVKRRSTVHGDFRLFIRLQATINSTLCFFQVSESGKHL